MVKVVLVLGFLTIGMIFFVLKKSEHVELSESEKNAESQEIFYAKSEQQVDSKAQRRVERDQDIRKQDISSKQNSKNEISQIADDHKELFPGLDTKEKLFEKKSTNGDEYFHPKIRERIGAKFGFDSYFGRKLKLIDLSEFSLIFLDLKGNKTGLIDLIKLETHVQKKYFFQNQRMISDLSDIRNPDTPVCVVNIRLDEVNIGSVDNLTLRVDRVLFPITEYAGFRGARIYFKADMLDSSWIESIDCIVKAVDDHGDRYKLFQVVHLLATIGAYGSAHLKD